MNDQAQCSATPPETRSSRIKWFFVSRLRLVQDVIRMLFLRLAYRHLMRLSHYFGWHYAPVRGPVIGGDYYRWCQWCGMRGSVVTNETITAQKRDGPQHGETK